MDLSNCYLHQLGSAEAEKLADIRSRIPAIFAKAREESPEAAALSKLTIWGVDMEEPGDASDMILLKYLRAEELNVDKSEERVAQTLIFRADCRIDALIESELPEHFQGHDCTYGRDVDGRPVMISRFGGMDIPKVFGDVEAFVRYRAKLMEEAIALLKWERGTAEDLCQVHDYSGVPLRPGADVKTCVNSVSKVFGDHYPEFKGKTMFVNFPAVFSTLWKAFSIAIPERTRKKFEILGANDHHILFSHIRPEFVPESLGGMLRDTRDCTSPAQIVTVAKGGTEEMQLAEVAAAGKVLWEVRVCMLEVAYEIIFKYEAGSGKTEEYVAKSEAGKNITAESGVVSGEFSAPGPGTMICRFTNDQSWYKSRLCVGRAQLCA